MYPVQKRTCEAFVAEHHGFYDERRLRTRCPDGLSVYDLTSDPEGGVRWGYSAPEGSVLVFAGTRTQITDPQNCKVKYAVYPLNDAEAYAEKLQADKTLFKTKALPAYENIVERHTIWTFADGSTLVDSTESGLCAYSKGEAFCL